jgi:hypothetical protein
MPKKIYMNIKTGKNKKNGKRENKDDNIEFSQIIRVPNAIFRGIIDGYDLNGNPIKSTNETYKDTLNKVNDNQL